jgi:ribosomal protein S13
MYIGLERVEGMEIKEIKEVEKAHLNKNDCNIAELTDEQVENLANIMAKIGLSGEDIDSEDG